MPPRVSVDDHAFCLCIRLLDHLLRMPVPKDYVNLAQVRSRRW